MNLKPLKLNQKRQKMNVEMMARKVITNVGAIVGSQKDRKDPRKIQTIFKQNKTALPIGKAALT